MPRWKEGSLEFTVSVNSHETRGYQCTIPKPVIEVLGDPEKITFVIKGRKVEIVPAEDQQ
jgi:bifunctional DNA-binding transcriptional regulator/antitoxin component of YhaV-PrlF toxin-antitoxin module